MNRLEQMLQRGLFIFLLSLVSVAIIHAQNKRCFLNQYVYLQTDRTIYAPGEVLWFKAFVCGDTATCKSNDRNNVYVSLIDAYGRIVGTCVKPVTEYAAEGGIAVPAGSGKGNYMLAAFTDIMKSGEPEGAFYKVVRVEPLGKGKISGYDSRAEEKNYQDSVSALPVLHIDITTGRNTTPDKEGITLVLKISDRDNIPVKASLSVSAVYAEFLQFSSRSDLKSYCALNHGSYASKKDDGNYTFSVSRIAVEILEQSLWNPAKSDATQKRDLVGHNDGRKDAQKASEKSQPDIFSMISKVKSYRIADDKILFANTGPNTTYNQDGALIVIDGVQMGDNISVLQYVLPENVRSINVSTDFVDIQRYTGFNTTGVIEIFTNAGDTNSDDDDGRKSSVSSLRKSTANEELIFDLTSAKSISRSGSGKTIYWNPSVLTDNSGTAIIDIFPGNSSSDIIIVVDGITADGRAVSAYHVHCRR